MSEKKVITISGVIKCLDNGMSREEIRDFYGLNNRELKKLFQHPKLKGKKMRKPVSFELIDDTEENNDVIGGELNTNIELDIENASAENNEPSDEPQEMEVSNWTNG